MFQNKTNTSSTGDHRQRVEDPGFLPLPLARLFHPAVGRLQRVDGEWNDAEIDLNRFIGNDNGISYR